jgi:hypothetical protein
MNRIIPTIHPLISDMRGENYWFNGCAAYAMECLGEPDYDYWFFAGLTGDIFTQFYFFKEYKHCAVSDVLMGPDYAQWVFDQVGYTCEYVTEQQLLANREYYLRKLMDSIDRGVPVICYGWGVFVGYEDDGRTLLYLTHERTEPKRLAVGGERFIAEPITPDEGQRDLHFDACELIFVGEKTRDVSLARLYREAIERLPALLTTRTDEYVFGAEAFRAWADDIESGKYDDPAVLGGGGLGDVGNPSWWNYTNYVCVLATNGSCFCSFLDKAIELNPDMAFLKEVYRQYRIMGMLWVSHKDADREQKLFTKEYKKRHGKTKSLEKLGGGFNVSYKTLQNPKKRANIVAKIREFADVMDEVVRILKEGL